MDCVIIVSREKRPGDEVVHDSNSLFSARQYTYSFNLNTFRLPVGCTISKTVEPERGGTTMVGSDTEEICKISSLNWLQWLLVDDVVIDP